MGLFEHFPYTNFHDLNLDVILKRVKDAEAAAQESAEDAAGSIAQAEAAATVANQAITTANQAALSANQAVSDAEAAQTAAEATQTAAEAVQTAAEAAQTAAETAQTAAEAAQSAAEDEAAAAAASAAASAASAAAAETAAETAASNAAVTYSLTIDSSGNIAVDNWDNWSSAQKNIFVNAMANGTARININDIGNIHNTNPTSYGNEAVYGSAVVSSGKRGYMINYLATNGSILALPTVYAIASCQLNIITTGGNFSYETGRARVFHTITVS